MRAMISEYYNSSKRGFVEDFRHSFGLLRLATVEDLKDFWDTYIAHGVEDKLEFFKQFGEANFTTVESRGYCQGDLSRVVVPRESWVFKNNSNSSIDFDHLIWDAPIYCRLTVDGVEYYPDELIKNIYNYDKTELLSIFKKLLSDHPACGYILQWLGSNLPKTPEYI